MSNLKTYQREIITLSYYPKAYKKQNEKHKIKNNQQKSYDIKYIKVKMAHIYRRMNLIIKYILSSQCA